MTTLQTSWILFLQKTKLVLLGDFNADLLKHDQNNNIFNHSQTGTRTSATLKDNIFTNSYNSYFVSGNLVGTLSDHHAQFLIIGNQLT